MKLNNEFAPIRKWAQEKGIYKEGHAETQVVKLMEEVGELSKAVLNRDHDEIVDAIGDIAIVLTSVAELSDDLFATDEHPNQIKIEECINKAYSVIKNRSGKMENGTFVKDM